MNRVYGEPVEVHTREDGHRPARFVWRGRSYAVRSVLEHWVVNREWWRDPDPAPAHPELEFWRVEADHSRSKDKTRTTTRTPASTSCAVTWRRIPGRSAA